MGLDWRLKGKVKVASQAGGGRNREMMKWVGKRKRNSVLSRRVVGTPIRFLDFWVGIWARRSGLERHLGVNT